jgi:splicing factor 3B subunit 3
VRRLSRCGPTGELAWLDSDPVQPTLGRCSPLPARSLLADYIIVGSDSGRISVFEYVESPHPAFKRLHLETFGKSGSRRIVPGQHLAVDPKGRSVMIGAVEKAKLVYVLNRDAASELTIGSPMEAHKNNAIITSMVGVDVGYDNPLYACLEVDYSESDQDPTGEAFINAEKVGPGACGRDR